MKMVECGLFRLPGISFEKGELSDSLLAEMKTWAEQDENYMYMNDRLWSFRNVCHRDVFILRWSDLMNKV